MAETYVQWVIKVVKHFSYNQNFAQWELSVLAPGLYSCIKMCNCLLLWNRLSKFHQISHGAFCRFVQMVPRHWIRWSPCPEPRKLWGWIMVYSIELKVYQVCSNDDCRFTFHLLWQGQICAPCIWMGEMMKSHFLKMYQRQMAETYSVWLKW